MDAAGFTEVQRRAASIRSPAVASSGFVIRNWSWTRFG